MDLDERTGNAVATRRLSAAQRGFYRGDRRPAQDRLQMQGWLRLRPYRGRGVSAFDQRADRMDEGRSRGARVADQGRRARGSDSGRVYDGECRSAERTGPG